MNICNCIQDLDAYLCDIPYEWRNGIIRALCLTFQEDIISCNEIQNCETLTSLSAFTIQESTVFIHYTNEKGVIKTSSFNLSDPIIEGPNLSQNCFLEWDSTTTFIEKIEDIIEAHCECCPTTTTTSTTTTTTICYDFYLADQYECVDFSGDCALGDEDVLVAVPCGFINTPGMFYPDTESSTTLYQIVSTALFGDPAIVLDVEAGSLSCSSFCPTSTTTTTTDPFDYYLTNRISCGDCGTILESNVRIRVFTGTGVVIGTFAFTTPFANEVYEIVSATTAGPSLDFTNFFFNFTCEAVCEEFGTTTSTTTTTTEETTSTTTTTTETTTTSTTTTTTSAPEFNFIIENAFSDGDNVIVDVTPPVYSIVEGELPLGGSDIINATHSGFTASLAVVVTGAPASGTTLKLSRDVTVIECINVTGDNTYTFASATFTIGEVCTIRWFNDGTCV